MPSYTTITDEETDPGAPVTSELMKKLRDNPLHVFEERGGKLPIEAGNVIRWRRDPETAGYPAIYEVGFSQIGNVRLTFQHRSQADRQCTVTRTRRGVTTTLATYSQSSSYATRTLDVGVHPDDIIQVESEGNSGNYDPGFLRNVRFMTSGMNFFPLGPTGYTENDYT